MRKIIIALLVLLALPAAAEETVEFGSWELIITEDIMTGSADYMLVNMAEIAQGTLRNPVLIVRPDGEDLEAFVHWGGYSVDRDARTVEVMADGEPTTVPISLSTDGDSVFFRGEFISQLQYYTNVAMLTSSNAGREMVARWDLSGYAEALQSMRGMD